LQTTGTPKGPFSELFGRKTGGVHLGDDLSEACGISGLGFAGGIVRDFQLLVSALNTAAIWGGLLLAPLAAGLSVKAVRTFNRSHQSPAALSGH
jgi:hypothetical protein